VLRQEEVDISQQTRHMKIKLKFIFVFRFSFVNCGDMYQHETINLLMDPGVSMRVPHTSLCKQCQIKIAHVSFVVTDTMHAQAIVNVFNKLSPPGAGKHDEKYWLLLPQAG
jgi:hypothetical protein